MKEYCSCVYWNPEYTHWEEMMHLWWVNMLNNTCDFIPVHVHHIKPIKSADNSQGEETHIFKFLKFWRGPDEWSEYIVYILYVVFEIMFIFSCFLKQTDSVETSSVHLDLLTADSLRTSSVLIKIPGEHPRVRVLVFSVCLGSRAPGCADSAGASAVPWTVPPSGLSHQGLRSAGGCCLWTNWVLQRTSLSGSEPLQEPPRDR